ncbi:hypothetical protein YN1_6960 [Nanoarchaeota archaeon]
MARSQLYLYTTVVLLLTLLYFLSNLDTISQELQFYSNVYPKYGEIYKLENGNYIYQNIINLYGSTLIPFTVYYNCSYNLLQIPNYFNSTHVIVLDQDFDFLPSYPSNDFVTFEIINNNSIEYQNSYCIFNGYEVYNNNFNITFQESGNNYYQIIFYPQSIFTINKQYLDELNNIYSVNFQYLNNYQCLSGQINSISLQKVLTGITINYLNISNAVLSGNNVQVTLFNDNVCPINLNYIYYDNYDIPEFGTSFNTSSGNYIINQNQGLLVYYNYTYDDLYFCLESLGEQNCIPINNVPVEYYVPLTIYNSQNIPTPQPFQQMIYIPDNSNIYNYIDSNGQNVLFFNPINGQIFYSWFEGNNGTGYIWWVKIPNGIPANSNYTIYMGIGSSTTDYYQLFYPYVGASPQVIQGYDNGQNVFIAYGYFNNNFNGWSGYIFYDNFAPNATPYGIEMLNGTNTGCEGTYILPPNNENILEIPLIVEEAWYESSGADANTISLFGNTNSQVFADSVGPITCGGGTPASNSSTFVQFEYYPGTCNQQYPDPAYYLKSAYANSILSWTSFTTSAGTFYTYLIVNNTYAQTGWYQYSSSQVWAPLTLLDTYSINQNSSTYANLNYSPFQYPTLEIGAGDCAPSYQYVEWVVARAYPPNGVMPSIYTGNLNPWPP